MFLEFYGLREQPFGVTPDPRFLYLSPAHREALASLYYGVESERGFMALIAKPGLGKTTLLFHLLEKFRHNARTVFLFQTQCNSREFMRFLLAELGVEGADQDFVHLHEQFNKMLLEEARAGRRFIVVIDEAQNLDASVLETVRLLSDFETPQTKLLQIILSGQPELADKLASSRLAQFRQRVSLLNGLAPLSVEESGRYIAHRLRVAGYIGQPLFDPPAMKAIAQFSAGIPRNINNCCFNLLSLGFALGKKIVDLSMVEEVIRDLDISRHLTEAAGAGDASCSGLTSAAATLKIAADGARAGLPPGNGRRPDALTPAEAMAYMQQLSLQLRDWKRRPGFAGDPSGARSKPGLLD
ncbi:MAG TPA: AAA family ATPase [Candidatus Sulfotelmatobacter sp.]|nr:AAA family ATPase [Candidatus Sulfotelmatobacter sp.]